MRTSPALLAIVLFLTGGCAAAGVERAAAGTPPRDVAVAGKETGPGAAARPGGTGAGGGRLAPLPVTQVVPAPDDGDAGGAGDADRGADDASAARDDVGPGGGAASGGGGAFTHPGVFVDLPRLDEMRARVAAGDEPWAAQFRQLRDSEWGSFDVVPSPRRVVECGPHEDPNHGCVEERHDAHAAYAHALAWYVTRDERHAEKSVEIMNAWSGTIEDHTHTNAHLQAGWAGAIWPRAAEIIRYTYDGWPPAEVERFEGMLRDAYLPDVLVRDYANGNWELAMTEAAIAIAVFLDDEATYATARATFLDRAEAYIYLDSDGAVPDDAAGSPYDEPDEVVGFWGNDDFGEGATQETCRDLNHAGLGLAGMSHTLTTTAIQGDDLYGRLGHRLASAIDLHARVAVTGEVPSWLCGGRLDGNLEYLPDSALTTLTGTYGCAMHHAREHNAGHQLPHGSNELLTAWEPLTHGTATAPPPGVAASEAVCPG